ncbi:MAG: glycerol-3-phosphate 1-O-acyltransferase PlsY [Turneriella sp.]
MDLLQAIYVASLSYLAGSIPTAYIAGYLVKGVDIRTIGSGNVGASNAMRLLGKKWGIGILLFDAIKGLIPVLLVQHTFFAADAAVQRYAMVSALAAMVGHVFPVWLGFSGGKGVATGLGVMTALIPIAVAVALPVFIVVVAVSRYISLGSIISALVLPAAFFIDHDLAGSAELFAFVCIACLFVIYKHKSNIKRIVAGEENRLGEKKT